MIDRQAVALTAPAAQHEVDPSHVALRLTNALWGMRVGRIETVQHLKGRRFEATFTNGLTPSTQREVERKFAVQVYTERGAILEVPTEWMTAPVAPAISPRAARAANDASVSEPREVNQDTLAVTAVCKFCASQYDSVISRAQYERGVNPWIAALNICGFCDRCCCHRCGKPVTGVFFCADCDRLIETEYNALVATAEPAVAPKRTALFPDAFAMDIPSPAARWHLAPCDYPVAGCTCAHQLVQTSDLDALDSAPATATPEMVLRMIHTIRTLQSVLYRVTTEQAAGEAPDDSLGAVRNLREEMSSDVLPV